MPRAKFAIVAAVEKDKKIIKTDAASVRVNLQTGKVVAPPKGP